MNYRLIDDYISDVTKDMGMGQQGEVAKELRAHILDGVDALATERKTAVDDEIINEVLAKMGPASLVAAMYPKPKLTRSGRPKMAPPLSKIDLVLEAIALIGLLLTIGFVIYGIINLPENIPTHVGPSGGVDSYGSKWILLSVLPMGNIIVYALITVTNRYPYILNYPTIVTEENAPRLYRLARSMMCWVKVLFVWTFVVMVWENIGVLPYDPGQSIDYSLFLFVLTIVTTLVMGYYIIKIYMAGIPKNDNKKFENNIK